MARVIESAQTDGMRYRATLQLQRLRQKIQTQAPSHETLQFDPRQGYAQLVTFLN